MMWRKPENLCTISLLGGISAEPLEIDASIVIIKYMKFLLSKNRYSICLLRNLMIKILEK
jgi:hypothetical protein